MAGIQITLKKASGDHEAINVTFPDGAVDEANIKVQREGFSFGVTYVSYRAKTNGLDRRSSDETTYEIDGPTGEVTPQQQEAAIKKVEKISRDFATSIEGDRDLNRLMDDVLATCTSTVQDAEIIKSHLGEVYKHIVAKQDGHGLTQVVNFVGFLEYGYQLTKKYIAKMRNEGKVGVFLASVVWALVTYSYNSGILTAALTSLRQLSRQPSNPFNLVLGGAVAAVVAASPHYKAAAAASVVALLGVGIAYWYFKK